MNSINLEKTASAHTRPVTRIQLTIPNIGSLDDLKNYPIGAWVNVAPRESVNPEPMIFAGKDLLDNYGQFYFIKPEGKSYTVYFAPGSLIDFPGYVSFRLFQSFDRSVEPNTEDYTKTKKVSEQTPLLKAQRIN
ncbi:hypothetical protein HYS31_04625 [Candidatus Woesearchaeota archaeon]|nr:hypothetical protein [Candidatus Woesearchaeota archaeon]